MDLAKHFASWSKDRSRKVGAVIVNPDTRVLLVSGYNGFPRGVNDNVDARHQRPEKYMWTIHAEENAVVNAARHGIATDGQAMFVTWFPCAPCANTIIQAGILVLVCVEPDWDDPKYGAEYKHSRIKLDEAGVQVVFLDGYESPVQKPMEELHAAQANPPT
jgi:dCMP deaminase